MTILLTGAGGYLGSVFTGELLKHGLEVDAVDILNYGDSGINPYVGLANYRFHEYDVRDLYHMRKLIQRATKVIHLAALVGEALCDEHPEETREVNTEATAALAEICGDNHTPMFFASTCSNYGVTSGMATERTPLNPRGLYAESKVEAEKAVSRIANHVIFRFATLYGVSPRMRLDLMLNEWTADMVRDGKVKVYQPQACRPILCVSDAAKVIKAFVTRYDYDLRGTYNVGVNEYNFTKQQIAEIIKREIGGEIEYVDRGDPRSYRVSFDKLSDKVLVQNTVAPSVAVHLVKRFLDNTPNTSRCYNRGAYLARGL